MIVGPGQTVCLGGVQVTLVRILPGGKGAAEITVEKAPEPEDGATVPTETTTPGDDIDRRIREAEKHLHPRSGVPVFAGIG